MAKLIISPTVRQESNWVEYGSEIRSSVIGRYVIFYRAVDGGIEVARVIAGDRDIRSL